MAKYRVKDGYTLPHNGEILKAGTEVELPAHVANDVAVRWMLEPGDDEAKLVLSQRPGTTVDQMALRGAAHERRASLEAQIKALDEQRDTLAKLLDAAKADEQKVVQQSQQQGGAVPTGQMINGVPVTVLDHGQGGTTAGVVHGEATNLTPSPTGGGTHIVDVPAQPQAPAQPASGAAVPPNPLAGTGGTVADQAMPQTADPAQTVQIHESR
jgi:ketosteroid isomerase-like protein